jgi:hypothetical protein
MAGDATVSSRRPSPDVAGAATATSWWRRVGVIVVANFVAIGRVGTLRHDEVDLGDLDGINIC